MRKFILGFFLVFMLTGLSGCQGVKTIGKGFADGAYEAWQDIKKADAWFRENCW